MTTPEDKALELLHKGSKVARTISNHSDKSDGEFAKVSIREAIEEATHLLKDVSQLARDTDDAKTYRVAGALIDSIVSAAKTLTDLPKADGEKGDNSFKPDGDKTVFLGPPSELMKMLEKRKKESDEAGRELDL